jgi:hypothetical protein
MKIRHNKKRNTAFVYEALVREGTSAILQKDSLRKDIIVKLIKKHFDSKSILRKDLECYRALYENQNLDQRYCARILQEVYRQKELIDPNKLFSSQTRLIDDINKEIEPTVFNNFVPNYKSLATIYQIFSQNINPKDRVLLENVLLRDMSAHRELSADRSEPLDNVLIETFVNKFNEKYNDELLNEQRQLLAYYISSFMDNALELKVFLNEEIARLKRKLSKAKEKAIFVEDVDMRAKADQIIEKLESFKADALDEKLLMVVLKTQSLVKEING